MAHACSLNIHPSSHQASESVYAEQLKDDSTFAGLPVQHRFGPTVRFSSDCFGMSSARLSLPVLPVLSRNVSQEIHDTTEAVGS